MSKAHNPLHVLTAVESTETTTIEAPTTKVTSAEATTTEVPTTEAMTTEATTNEATIAETETTNVPTTEVTTLTMEATTTEAPTMEAPATDATTAVGFSLNGTTYPNGSTVLRDDIGEGDNALLCTTDKGDCCNDIISRAGEFYFPNGSQVPIQGDIGSSGYYRNRGVQLIRLNRQSNGVLTGQFRCKIPSSVQDNSVFYINIGTHLKYGPF